MTCQNNDYLLRSLELKAMQEWMVFAQWEKFEHCFCSL
jgi:hypothetical protein